MHSCPFFFYIYINSSSICRYSEYLPAHKHTLKMHVFITVYFFFLNTYLFLKINVFVESAKQNGCCNSRWAYDGWLAFRCIVVYVWYDAFYLLYTIIHNKRVVLIRACAIAYSIVAKILKLHNSRCIICYCFLTINIYTNRFMCKKKTFLYK